MDKDCSIEPGVGIGHDPAGRPRALPLRQRAGRRGPAQGDARPPRGTHPTGGRQGPPALQQAFKPPPKLSDDWEAAHLADVPAPIDSTEAFRSFLSNTKELKRRLLGAEGYMDLAASAEVTFAVPRSAWDAA